MTTAFRTFLALVVCFTLATAAVLITTAPFVDALFWLLVLRDGRHTLATDCGGSPLPRARCCYPGNTKPLAGCCAAPVQT